MKARTRGDMSDRGDARVRGDATESLPVRDADHMTVVVKMGVSGEPPDDIIPLFGKSESVDLMTRALGAWEHLITLVYISHWSAVASRPFTILLNYSARR